MIAERLASVSALDAGWDALFGPGVQSGRAWFAATEQAALPPGATPLYLAVRDAGRPAALLPLRTGPGRAATSLTSPYTIHYQPLLAPAAGPDAAGHAIGHALARTPTTVLQALDPAWPGLAPFTAGLRRAGLVPFRFDQFGNWTQDLRGLDWPAYLAARPGPLRETIRRRTRAIERDPAIRIEIATTPEQIVPALAAYETVYATSWKTPEPFPHFNAALLTRLAPLGQARLGVLWQGARPLAAQYWTVQDGTATVLKLAHDEAAKTLSPGTVLTAHIIRTLIGQGATSLDFGRGDDPYKQLWTTTRRPRIGLLIANPRHPAGLLALARQAAGAARRRLTPRPGSAT